MRIINYTLELSDCEDFAKYQHKIPRIRKLYFKMYLVFVVMALMFLAYSLTHKLDYLPVLVLFIIIAVSIVLIIGHKLQSKQIFKMRI